MAANYEQPEDVVTRVRFFDGQYLQDQDFIDEQHYHTDRQRRHQRLLHGAGVAEGLTVTPIAGTVQVEVAPGTAIDADGRVIVVTDEPEADRVVNLADHLGRTVNLYVAYQEVETNPQATGAADFGRWLEKPLFEVVDVQSAHDFPHPPVVLARIVLNNQGIERIDTSPVVYSGLRLPGPGPEAATLRTVTGGTVELRAPLRVTGNTAVTGDATIDGSVRFGRSTRQMLNLWDANYGIGVQSSTQYFRTDFHFAWYQGGSHNNAELNPGGGTAVMVLKGGNLGVGVPNPTSRLHVSGAVAVAGDTTLTGGLSVTGDANVGRRLSVTGDTTMAGRLSVTADTTIAGALSFGRATRQMINLWDTGYGIGIQGATQYYRTDRNFVWYRGGVHHDGELNAGGGTLDMVLRQGNLGIGTAAPNHRLTVFGDTSNQTRDPDSGLSSGGQIAVKGVAPQIDFVDTNGNDWAIHVNSNRLYFIRQPWEHADLVLDGAGNVGIGTPDPRAKLDVRGAMSVEGALSFGRTTRQMINLWDTNYGIGIQNSTQYYRTDGNFVWYRGGAHNDGELNAGGGTLEMVLRRGNLGVGLANPSQRLDVNGNMQVSGGGRLILRNGDGSAQWEIFPEWGDAGDPDLFFDFSGNASTWASGWLEPLGGGWRNNSDARLKQDVAPLTPVLDGILKLTPRSYRFSHASPGGRRSIGFLAQNVEQFFPELVVEKRGFLSLNYSDFSVLAIAAIQEQQAMIAGLQARLDALTAGTGTDTGTGTGTGTTVDTQGSER